MKLIIICIIPIVIMLITIIYTIATGQFHALSKELIILTILSLILFLLSKIGKKVDSINKTDATEEIPQPTLEQPSLSRLDVEKKLSEEFENVLTSISRIKVILSDTIYPKINISDMPEYNFSSIIHKKDDSIESFTNRYGDFTVVDVETTGLNVSSCEIIEVSAVKFRNYKPISCFESLLKPIKSISSEITQLTGISNSMVENSPRFSQVIDSLKDFIGEDNIIGHNLEFDLKFLFKSGYNMFLTKRKYYDTLSLSKSTFKKYNDRTMDGVYNYKLDTLCHYNNIYRNTAHRSSSDCYATGLLFRKIVCSK